MNRCLFVVLILLSCLYGYAYDPPIRRKQWKRDLLDASQLLAKDGHIIVSLSNEWHERDHVINFILRMKIIGVENYVVLCYSYDIYKTIVGSWQEGLHGVLVVEPPPQSEEGVNMMKMEPLLSEKVGVAHEKKHVQQEAVLLLLENNFRVTVTRPSCIWVSRSTLHWLEHNSLSHIDILTLSQSSKSLEDVFDSPFVSLRPTSATKEAYLEHVHSQQAREPSSTLTILHQVLRGNLTVPHIDSEVMSLSPEQSYVQVGCLPPDIFVNNKWCNVTSPLLYCYRGATLRLVKDSSLYTLPRKWRKIQSPQELTRYVEELSSEVSRWNEKGGIISQDYSKCMDYSSPSFVSQLATIASAYARRSGDMKYMMVTSSDWIYRGVLINWMSALARMGVSEYLVLCFGQRIYRLVGGDAASGGHGVLITGWGTVNNMFHTRHRVANVLLRLGYTVTLIDSDAVLLKPSLFSTWVAPFEGKADIIAQMGRHPSTLAERNGAAVCAGFLTVYPTRKSILFYDYLFAFTRNSTIQLDDQKAINLALEASGAFHFPRKVQFVTNKSSELYGKVTLASSGDKEELLRLGFYPSAQFPRAEIDDKTWSVYATEHQPLIWHLLTKKSGNDKVYTMQYFQGVYVLDENEKWRELISFPQLKEYLAVY